MEGRDSWGIWDGRVHRAVFKLDNRLGPAQCYVAAWMGGQLVGEQIHVCVWPSPFAVQLKLSQQC